MEFDVIGETQILFFMKKKNQEVSKGKLKLNKERIAALSSNTITKVNGGKGIKKERAVLSFADDCVGQQTIGTI